MSIHMSIILYLLCACLASLCCLGVTLELSLEFTSQCDFLNAPNISAALCRLLQYYGSGGIYTMAYRDEVKFIGVVTGYKMRWSDMWWDEWTPAMTIPSTTGFLKVLLSFIVFLEFFASIVLQISHVKTRRILAYTFTFFQKSWQKCWLKLKSYGWASAHLPLRLPVLTFLKLSPTSYKPHLLPTAILYYYYILHPPVAGMFSLLHLQSTLAQSCPLCNC